jgi:hypothetical protein
MAVSAGTGLIVAAANPDERGSLLSVTVGRTLNPKDRGSPLRAGGRITEAKGTSRCGLMTAALVDPCRTGSWAISGELRVSAGENGDGPCEGLSVGLFSALLGGVLKGDTLTSIDGRRGSGVNRPEVAWVMAKGLAGIRGFSLRLTGGGGCLLGEAGLGKYWDSALEFPFCLFRTKSSSKPGDGCRVEDLLECCDISSRTFPKGVLSGLSGDLELLRVKNVIGGDRGDSTFTTGPRFGEEEDICIDIGRL